MTEQNSSHGLKELRELLRKGSYPWNTDANVYTRLGFLETLCQQFGIELEHDRIAAATLLIIGDMFGSQAFIVYDTSSEILGYS